MRQWRSTFVTVLEAAIDLPSAPAGGAFRTTHASAAAQASAPKRHLQLKSLRSVKRWISAIFRNSSTKSV